MRIEPLLVLVSGSASQHTASLAFATTAKGLNFTSCSGILLTTGASHSGLVLLPAAVLRPWLQPGTSWLTSVGCHDPPPLAPDCGICAVGPTSAVPGGAATCIPIATVRVPGVSRAAAQLLTGLNRDSFTDRNWAFEWHVGGASCTPAEQGAFVLCWAQPLTGTGGSGAAAAAGLAPSPPPRPRDTSASPHAPATGDSSSTSCNASAAVLGALSNSQCLHLLQALRASLAATCTSAGGTVTATAAAAAPQREDDSYSHGAVASDASAAASSGSPCAGPGAAPGRLVTIVGSPFGSLAPFHFSNAHINGAVACAFPATPAAPSAAAGPRLPALPPGARADRSTAAIAAASVSGCGCGLGPALYALDAHVFPGMEGALVTPLQMPLASLAAVPPPTAVAAAAATELRDDAVSDAAAAVESCSGGGGGGTAWQQQQPQPLAVLCTPVGRRADGVQVTLAAAWPHVAVALAAAVERLLRRAMGLAAAADDTVAAGRRAAAAGGPPERQQLQLQPVALIMGGGSDGWCSGAGAEGGTCGGGGGGGVSDTSTAIQSRPGSKLCCDGGARGALAPGRQTSGAGAAPCSGRGAPWPAVGNSGGTLRWVSSATAGRPPAAAYSAEMPGRPAVAAAPTAASAAPAASFATDASAHFCPGTAAGAGGGLPAAALQSVVLLRCNGSWATGVLVEERTGLLITTAHLFQSRHAAGGGGNGGATAHAGQKGDGGGDAWAHVPCWARVPWVTGGGGAAPCGVCGAAAVPGQGAPAYRWLRARVLYSWSNHLDLAVLQLEPLYGSHRAQPPVVAAPPPMALAAVRETARAREEGEREIFARTRSCELAAAASGASGGDDGDGGEATCGIYGAGSPVWAVGHSLVGPAAEWPALVSYGCVARVLRGRGGRPSMVIATTTTHAGGSGGALLDAGGRLVGLVTSNARHAGGATLPNMAFCIAAEELQPVVAWAARMARAAEAAESSPGDMGPGAPGSLGVSSLRALDVEDEDAARIWRLQMPSLEAPPSASGPDAPPARALSRL